MDDLRGNISNDNFGKSEQKSQFLLSCAFFVLVFTLTILQPIWIIISVGCSNFLYALEDHTDNTDLCIVEENVSLESVFSYHFVKALQNVAETNKIEVSFNEYEVNQILYAASRNIETQDFKVRSIYTEFLDDGYRLFIPITIKNIETLVSCSLELSEKNNVICAKIKDVKVGNLHDSTINAIMGIVSRVIKNELSKHSIQTEIRNNEIKVLISRETLGDIIDELTDEDPMCDIVSVAYDFLMLQTDAVKLNLSNPQSSSLVIDMKCFGQNKSTRFESFNVTMNELLVSGVANKNNFNTVSKFFVNGYDFLNDNERAIIIEAFSNKTTSIGEITNYQGFYDRDTTPTSIVDTAQQCVNNYFSGLEEIVNSIQWWEIIVPGENIEKFNQYITNNCVLGLASESTLQSFVDSLNFEGAVMSVMCDINNEVCYFIVEETDLRVTDCGLELLVYINVNGFVLPLSLEVNIDNEYANDLSFIVDKICIGNCSMDDCSIKKICGFVGSFLDVEQISICGRQIKVNVTQIITELLNTTFDLPISAETVSSLLKCIYIISENEALNLRFDESKMLECVGDIASQMFNDCFNALTQ